MTRTMRIGAFLGGLTVLALGCATIYVELPQTVAQKAVCGGTACGGDGASPPEQRYERSGGSDTDGPIMGLPLPFVWGGGPELLLEYDSIDDARAITTKADGLTLESSYCMPDTQGICGGLAVVVDKQVVTDPNLVLDSCVNEMSLDQQIGCTRDLGPERGQWYAHGLATTSLLKEGTGDYCLDYWGMLWLTEAACDLENRESEGSEDQIRRDFVVFDADRRADSRTNRTKGNDTLMGIAVHELAHVLNIHHEDMAEEKSTLSGELGQVSRDHLAFKLFPPESIPYLHVAPGADPRFPFCQYTSSQEWPFSTDEHDLKHCCGDLGAAYVLGSAPAILRIKPEKLLYCPGEPITINVTLKAASPVEIYPHFDPELGHLVLWNDDGRGFHRLTTPRYIDARLTPKSLAPGEELAEQGIDIWFGTGLNQEVYSLLKASFHGFDPSGFVVSSRPVKVHVEDYNGVLCNTDARRLFDSPQSRRFMWLMGGDHLKTGIANLKQISDHYPNSVYAPYANLALGRNWVRRFHYVTESRTMAVRDRNLAEAGDYLLRARHQMHLLPESMRAILNHHVPAFVLDPNDVIWP